MNMYIWIVTPIVGVTPKSDAPVNALVERMQYGIAAQGCNIDTEVLWYWHEFSILLKSMVTTLLFMTYMLLLSITMLYIGLENNTKS